MMAMVIVTNNILGKTERSITLFEELIEELKVRSAREIQDSFSSFKYDIWYKSDSSKLFSPKVILAITWIIIVELPETPVMTEKQQEEVKRSQTQVKWIIPPFFRNIGMFLSKFPIIIFTSFPSLSSGMLASSVVSNTADCFDFADCLVQNQLVIVQKWPLPRPSFKRC